MLNSGIVDPKNIISEFCSKFQKTERTFWNKWKIAQSEYQILLTERQKAKNSTIVSNDVENVSNGLKSKSERLMNLQRQADDIQRMLDSNITPDIVKSPKELQYMEIERKLTYVERASLMKALRDLQSEISKIEGDYAATKQDVKLTESFSIKDALKDFMNK
jgi:predicted nuclease with TOPRIM domain